MPLDSFDKEDSSVVSEEKSNNHFIASFFLILNIIQFSISSPIVYNRKNISIIREKSKKMKRTVRFDRPTHAHIYTHRY